MGLRLVIMDNENIVLDDHGDDGILPDLIQRLKRKLDCRSLLLSNPWAKEVISTDVAAAYYDIVNDFKEKTIKLS